MLIEEGHDVPRNILDQMEISVEDRNRHAVVWKLLSRSVCLVLNLLDHLLVSLFVAWKRNCSSVFALNNAKHVSVNNAKQCMWTVFVCAVQCVVALPQLKKHLPHHLSVVCAVFVYNPVSVSPVDARN